MTILVQCVDSHDTPLFVKEKLAVHQGEGILHRAVSVYIFSPDRQSILIQQRAAHKYHSPLVWQNTCCTHPYINEDPQHSAERRLFEEMGLAHIPLEKKLTFEYKTPVWDDLVEREYLHVFIGETGQDPLPNPDEVADTAWISIDTLTQRSQTPDYIYEGKKLAPRTALTRPRVLSQLGQY